VDKPDWREQTCETCYFQIHRDCRFNPPSITGYTCMGIIGLRWSPACSRWKHKHECQQCDGSGQLVYGSDSECVVETCGACHGTGRVVIE